MGDWGYEAVKFLLDNGADLNLGCTYSNMTPLHHAARSGELDIVRLLVERGADLEAERKKDCTEAGLTPVDMMRGLKGYCYWVSRYSNDPHKKQATLDYLESPECAEASAAAKARAEGGGEKAVPATQPVAAGTTLAEAVALLGGPEDIELYTDAIASMKDDMQAETNPVRRGHQMRDLAGMQSHVADALAEISSKWSARDEALKAQIKALQSEQAALAAAKQMVDEAFGEGAFTTPESLRKLFDAIDTGATGRISTSEFQKAMAGKRKHQLRPLLGSGTGEKWKEMLKRIDSNNDGYVDFEEFLEASK